MSKNTIVILSEEFMARINVGLGEVAAKFSVPVLQELQAWVDKAEKVPHEIVALVENHIAPLKAKIAADKAEAERVAALPKEIASDVAKAV